MNVTESHIDDGDRLYDLPLVDLLVVDLAWTRYTITFAPSDDVALSQTEVIELQAKSEEFARVESLFSQVQTIVGEERAIVRASDGGGGDYTFHFECGPAISLSSLPSNATTHEISDHLKHIAESAQAQFLIERRQSVRR